MFDVCLDLVRRFLRLFLGGRPNSMTADKCECSTESESSQDTLFAQMVCGAQQGRWTVKKFRGASNNGKSFDEDLSGQTTNPNSFQVFKFYT